MADDSTDTGVQQAIADLYRTESRRVFATLVRLLGDFDLAEEALHEAFAQAVAQWPSEGLPDRPRNWLVSAGRFKAIDAIRRRARLDASLADVGRRNASIAAGNDAAAEYLGEEDIDDDRLRLIFTCCHPALSSSTQVALTLREVCGLSTEEVASAFLVPPATIAQRIVRGKAKIRDAAIPYVVPVAAELPQRLDSALSVVYLVFNEGYAASAGDSLTRPDLSAEAIRLGRLLVELLPDAETLGLLALMLLSESRRPARTSPAGDLILLEEQDRSLWNRTQIAEGTALVERALSVGPVGAYAIQAAIAAVHAGAPTAEATDWARIAAWYDLLQQSAPSPVVELNRAVAIAMRDGPAAGLPLIEALLARGDLADYHLAHAARADLCRRLGRTADARAAYEAALGLARQEPERRFLAARLAGL